MKIDFEYSKWADQADRKRAFADMTFNAKMHCELQRMSTCRELAKIGQYHERECKHLRDTSIDLVDMLHALRLMKDVIGTSSLIDETYTRPDNIRFARTLSVGDCNSPEDAVRLLDGFRSLALRIIVERTGDSPDDDDMKRILDSASGTTETRESVFEFHSNGMSGFLYAMNVVYATAVQMLMCSGSDVEIHSRQKKFKERVEIEHRALADEENTTGLLIREEERFASTKALAKVATTADHDLLIDADPINMFKTIEHLTVIYRNGEELDFFYGNTVTDYDEVLDLISESCNSNLNAISLIKKHRDLARKQIAARAKNGVGVGVFDDALNETELRQILDSEANAKDFCEQVANRELLGVTNSLYTEVIVYAATSLMVGQYTERTRQVEHTRPAGKHRNKNSRVKIAQ